MLLQEQSHQQFASPVTMTKAPPSDQSIFTQSPQHSHIWIVTGPAGCGKSTVAKSLASVFSLPYIEGDEFHPAPNIEKMSKGIPLTDADRWDWLILLREEAIGRLKTGSTGVVLTCSALKRKYRDVIRIAAYQAAEVVVHFIYLQAPEDVLINRVMARQGHYMKPNMVRSQFTSLEEPTPQETDTLTIDVSGTMPEVEASVLTEVTKVLATDGQIGLPMTTPPATATS